jgi:DNA-binding FadR family transcriptional regulator
MSDARVRAAIEQMEAWLANLNWVPDPGALSQWDVEFHASLAQAEKAPGWTELMARAHAAGQQLKDRTVVFAEMRDQLRKELEAHERGSRALKGYGASSR